MRQLKISVILLLLIPILSTASFAGGPNYFRGKGRIVVSSDGNFHDEDDWAASAATLMILAKAKLQDKLVAYTYSDHVWESTPKGLAEMTESVVNGGVKFGYTNTAFIEAASAPETAYNAIRDAINASTADNPLFILAGGPMQVVGEGLNRADADALNYVTIISHSTWNDNHADNPQRKIGKVDYDHVNHSGWTWSELKRKFGSKVNFKHIADQNNYESADVGFASTNASAEGRKYWDPWYWMRDHSNAVVRWVFSRAQTMGRPDWSDAGMAFYLLKGYDGGGPLNLKAFIGTNFEEAPNDEVGDRR